MSIQKRKIKSPPKSRPASMGSAPKVKTPKLEGGEIDTEVDARGKEPHTNFRDDLTMKEKHSDDYA